MNKRWRNAAVGVISAVLVLVVVLPAAPPAAAADEVTVNMRPDVIILNSQGDAEEVVAQIDLPITPGHSIQSFDISLRFDGVHVADAFALVYCYSDGLYAASFDKKELLQNQDVIGMAKFHARLVVTAAYMRPIEIPLGQMLTSEMSITTAMGYPTEMPEVVAALPRLQDRLRPMISHHFPLDRITEALDAARDPSSAKVMVDIGPN